MQKRPALGAWHCTWHCVGIAAMAAGSLGLVACDQILGSSALHLGECDVGERQCGEDLTPQICNQDLEWKDEAACPYLCSEGQCIGVCTPGEKYCAGTTPQLCEPNAQWYSEPACDAVTQHCSGGECVVSCTPNDLRCLTDYLSQRCDSNGEWQTNGEPCAGCMPCDETTGTCRESSLPDDSPCLSPDDKCLLAGTCLSGVCTPVANGGHVECLAESQCDASACDPKTGSCAVMEAKSCEDGDACTAASTCQGGVCTGSPASDPTWAHWNPQLDPQFPPPSPRYTWTDSVVLDVVTRLMWQRKTPKAGHDWESAKSYCACLNDGNDSQCEKVPGYPSGWRLPTRIELASIVDYSRRNPCIDPEAFPGTIPTSYWSSSPSAFLQGAAWAVDFYYGSAGSYDVDSTVRIRCVR